MDVYTNHVLFGSARPNMDAMVKRELGHDMLYKGLLSKTSYDPRHDIPEEVDLRILSEGAAKEALKKMCKSTNSNLKIALNYAQTLDLFHNMPKKKMPIDVMLLYKLFETQDDGSEIDLHELITKEIFPYILLEDGLNPEEQNPVIVVFYQTLDDALAHLETREHVIPPEKRAIIEDETIARKQKEREIIDALINENLPGVMFSQKKNLMSLTDLVKGVIQQKSRCLQNRGVVFRS